MAYEYPLISDLDWMQENAPLPRQVPLPVVLTRMVLATEVNTAQLRTGVYGVVNGMIMGGITSNQNATLHSASVAGPPPSDEDAAASVVALLSGTMQASHERQSNVAPPELYGDDLWRVQLTNGARHIVNIPHNLPEGSEWWIQLVDCQWHRIRIPSQGQRFPPTRFFTPSPSTLSPTTSFASTGPETPENFVARDAPIYAGGDIATNDADAINTFPENNFQPVVQAAPAPRLTNFHISGNARSMPYPAEKPQAAAPRADLMANNPKSTGATLMGGALAGDAGGIALSHTSAAQAAEGPAFCTSCDPWHAWTGKDAEPAPPTLCPYLECKAKTKLRWRHRPVITGKQRFNSHLDTHRPAEEKEMNVECPKCGQDAGRRDMSRRHIDSCKGLREDHDPDVGGMGGGSGSSQAGPSRLAA